VATFDIDHFHTINDEFGVDVGDRALLHVAAVCLRDKRNTDLVARLGSDKFAVLMPNTVGNEARVFAERLRTAVACYPLYLDERPIRLTVSVGVAQSAAEMSGIAALLKSADECLCIAKERGRNTLVHAANDTEAVINFRGKPSASAHSSSAKLSSRVGAEMVLIGPAAPVLPGPPG
jgi:diguanylate cyclase (GGDEF)-like protein